MAGQKTIVLFVHGANQSEKTRDTDNQRWHDAFEAEPDNAAKILGVLSGARNGEIADYHDARHPGADYPQFLEGSEGWRSAWYGGVWRELLDQGETADQLGQRLNPSYQEEGDERGDILGKVERKVIKSHFDEIVPYYELAVIKGTRETLYERICSRVLTDLENATDGGKLHWVIVAHSMGCAVSYNVLSHLSCAAAGETYCDVRGALSDGYRQRVQKLADAGGKCFALMTFGNYTAYNWAQRLNNRMLFGRSKKQFRYPDAAGRWFNFFTMLGGDPYILDDKIESSMVDDDEDRFDDVRVHRVPGREIGHSRTMWFRRDSFVKRLCNKMERHLYL